MGGITFEKFCKEADGNLFGDKIKKECGKFGIYLIGQFKCYSKTEDKACTCSYRDSRTYCSVVS